MARFGRKDDDKGSEWVPDEQDEGSEEPFVGYPAEGQYDAERVEEEIYDQRDQGVEVVAEGADEEPRPGSLTEQAARDAEARADAAAAPSRSAQAGNGGSGALSHKPPGARLLELNKLLRSYS